MANDIQKEGYNFDYETISGRIEQLINKTPTGEERNTLCDTNIFLHHQDSLIKDLKEALNKIEK